MTQTFAVVSYVYQVGYRNTATFGGVTIQYQGSLSARGGVGPSRFTVYGLHPKSLVPTSAYCNATETDGAIFVPFSDLYNYVDIVRNERPVYVTLDLATGMYFATGFEPPGEEEGL